MKYTDQQLLTRVKGLPSFKCIPLERWILGVRSKADAPNKFDDKFYEFEGQRFLRVLTGTTNPGVTILKNFAKYSKLGAAVVKADQWYYGVWKYGLHKGKVPALLQLGAPILVHRDNDGDDKSEQLGTPISGFFGINYHTNTYDLSAPNLKIKKTDIDAWSAGCQVPNDRYAFAEQMGYYKEALKTGKQTSVTYCLINQF